MTQIRSPPGERNTSRNSEDSCCPGYARTKSKEGSERTTHKTPVRWRRAHGACLNCFVICTVLGTGL